MSKSKNKSDLVRYTFRVSVQPEGPYRVRTLGIVQRRRTGTATQLRKCSCSEERARLKQVHEHWGLDHHFSDLDCPAVVKLAWLESREGDGWVACSPDVDAGSTFDEISRGLELLQKVGAAVCRRAGDRAVTDATFADPKTVIAALRKSTIFIEVERFEADGVRYWVETHPALAGGEAA